MKVDVATSEDFPPGKPGVNRAWTREEYRRLNEEKGAAKAMYDAHFTATQEAFAAFMEDPMNGAKLTELLRLVSTYHEVFKNFHNMKSRVVEATRWLEGRVRQ